MEPCLAGLGREQLASTRMVGKGWRLVVEALAELGVELGQMGAELGRMEL